MSANSQSKLISLTLFAFMFASPFSSTFSKEQTQCSINSLKELLNTSPKNLKPSLTTPGQKEYYNNGKLKMLSTEWPNEHSYTEIIYWVLSKNDFVAEFKKTWYEDDEHTKSQGPYANIFFICNNKIVKINNINGIKPNKYNEMNIETSVEIYKEIMSSIKLPKDVKKQ